MEVRVRAEKEKNRHFETTRFYVNDVLVCTCEKGGDYYCTVNRSGNPSNIRDKWKKTYSTNWHHWEIKDLVGSAFDNSDFKNEYPDLKFGYQGSVVSAKKVKELFNKYLNPPSL